MPRLRPRPSVSSARNAGGPPPTRASSGTSGRVSPICPPPIAESIAAIGSVPSGGASRAAAITPSPIERTESIGTTSREAPTRAAEKIPIPAARSRLCTVYSSASRPAPRVAASSR